MSVKENAADGRSAKQIRLEQEAAEKAAAKKRRTWIIVGVVAFLVIAILAIIVTSNTFIRNTTAVEINGTKWTIADFNLQYYNQYILMRSELESVLGEDADESLLPTTAKSLKQQVYDTKTGETWDERLTSMALDTMREVTVLCDAAEAAGHELNESEKIAMSNEINSLAMYANYASTDKDTYASMQYGRGVNYEVYKRNIEKLYLADSYARKIETEYKGSDAELDAYYAENRDTFDVISYRSYFFTGDDAKAKAEEFAGKITDEASFAELCREYCKDSEKEDYADDDESLTVTSGGLIVNTFHDWIVDSVRQAGDVTVSEAAAGCYVVYYVGRDNNEYPSVNMEFFCIATEMPDESSYASHEEYQEAADKRIESVSATADTLFEEWKGGASFDEIKENYGSYLYQSGAAEGVSKRSYPDEVTEWLFDESRKEGDMELIATEDSEFYAVKYLGTGMTYARFVANSKLANEAYRNWVEEKCEGYEVKTNFFMNLAK